MTFHYTGWLKGLLIMAYYNNPYITGRHNPLYKTTNQGFENCLYVPFKHHQEKVDETIISIPLGR